MEALRRFSAIVLADTRQRWRAPRLGAAVLTLVVATWFCFPPADAGYRVLGIGTYRVAPGSDWAGMVVAMLMVWLSLLGFFLVRGTLVRDFASNVWQLLVATPLSRPAYLVAKWASHLLVLGTIAGGMLVVAAIAVLVRVGADGFDPLALALPLLLLGVPALAVCALCAVLFDLVPWLRGTLGNALYVVLWVLMLVSGSLGHDAPAPATLRIGDVHGLAIFEREVAAVTAGRGIDPAATTVCLLCGSAATEAEALAWRPWSPAPADLGGRLFWLLLPLPVLALAARWLDRAAAATPAAGQKGPTVRRLGWLRWLLSPLQRNNGSALVSLELQHALRERPLFAWGVLVAGWIVQLAASPGVASLAVIAAWALFLPVFSRAALRERETATADVVFTGASAAARLLRARAAVLVLLGVACAAPALARFALAEPALAAALLVLAGSLAAWSLALGALTGSARPFELLFVLGALLALNGVGALDASVAPVSTLGAHAALLPVALVLLALAWPRHCRAQAGA